MNYACEDCGFLFFRMGEVQECPFCEERHIRPATGEETLRLKEHHCFSETELGEGFSS